MHDGIILITFKFTIVVLSFRQTSEMQGTKFKTSERKSRSISNSGQPRPMHGWEVSHSVKRNTDFITEDLDLKWSFP